METVVCPKCLKTNTGTNVMYSCQFCGETLRRSNVQGGISDRRLLRIDPMQAGMAGAIIGLIAAAVGFVFVVISSLLDVQSGAETNISGWLAILVLVPIEGFISWALSCWFLNIVLRRIGGLRLTFLD